MKASNVFIIVLIVFFAGYFTGRISVEENTTEIEYWEVGEKITGEVKPDEVLTTEEIPDEVVLPSDIFAKNSTPASTILPITTKTNCEEGCQCKKETTVRQAQGNDSIHIYRAVYNDYIKIRRNIAPIFDNDTIGTLNVYETIQYNRAQGYRYDFQPRIKHIKTILPTKPITFIPFASSSYSTADYWGIGGGFFYHNLGFEYQYQIDLRKSKVDFEPRGNEHLVGLKYKFR